MDKDYTSRVILLKHKKRINLVGGREKYDILFDEGLLLFAVTSPLSKYC